VDGAFADRLATRTHASSEPPNTDCNGPLAESVEHGRADCHKSGEWCEERLEYGLIIHGAVPSADWAGAA
jgi:hypothetical protein